jgi:hypothetical protein
MSHKYAMIQTIRKLKREWLARVPHIEDLLAGYYRMCMFRCEEECEPQDVMDKFTRKCKDRAAQMGVRLLVDCPTCNGAGRLKKNSLLPLFNTLVPGQECGDCEGTGRIDIEKAEELQKET